MEETPEADQTMSAMPNQQINKKQTMANLGSSLLSWL
jgi:hypothetical protein